MKISYNYLTNYIPDGTSVEEVVKRIGTQLGEVDGVENLAEKYQGIVLARIATVQKHPDADKLNICMVDDGGVVKDIERNSDGHVQVVCGAPNVAEGMMVAWLPPGVVVPETYGTDEPFTLGARELRGVNSSGMIASAKELALGEGHDGILNIEVPTYSKSKKPANEVPMAEALSNRETVETSKPGDSFADTFALNDHIIDIENKMFTHRPDCFGQMGVAREVAGIFGLQYESPADYSAELTGAATTESLEASIETDLVSRFTAQVVKNIEVGPSTLYRQIQLRKIGVRPINAIVDITNYFMHLTGQPLHAYDYDKLAARSSGTPRLIARLSNEGEKLTLLDGRKITFDKPAVVIATDTEVVGVGGAMGGADTEVDETTTNIVFEAATFDMYSIRRTSMHYGLFTEAVTRFNKGQSPHQTAAVLAWAVEETLCLKSTGNKAEAASTFVDVKHGELPENNPVEITTQFINSRLGSSLAAEDITQMLKNVEFNVDVEQEQLTVTAPFWRTDISIKEDIVEEIGRLYGYDKLPLTLPMRSSKPTAVNEVLDQKQKIRGALARSGANEVLTYSFVHGDLLKKAGQKPEDSYGITNALSPDLQYYRQTLMPSLLSIVNPNVRAGFVEHAVFEIGKTHNRIHEKEGDLPGEIEMTALVYVKPAKDEQPAYFTAREYLVQLAASFGHTLEFKPVPGGMDYPITSPYENSRSALVNIKNGPFLGIVGEFTATVTANFKLPEAAGFEIDTGALGAAEWNSPYTVQSKFPSSHQDVTIQTEGVLYSDLEKSILGSLSETDYITDVKCMSVYTPENGKTNTTFAVTLSHPERTLTTEEVSTVINKLVTAAQEQQKATQV